MRWFESFERLSPYVFKIESPSGHGTGFLCHISEDKRVIGIATANHVVDEADRWEQPLRITHYQSGKTKLVKDEGRVIFDNKEKDSALIILPPSIFELPESLPPFLPGDRILKVGCEIGWMGFPSVEPSTLCFFSGIISAAIVSRDAYLIDGVAINGVSGGPVFQTFGEGPTAEDRIIGIVTAYIPNRVAGDALPGLAMAQDVSHFVTISSELKNLDEAREKKQELKEDVPQELPAPPDIPQSPDPTE